MIEDFFGPMNGIRVEKRKNRKGGDKNRYMALDLILRIVLWRRNIFPESNIWVKMIKLT
jgi:hypothetical protein